MATQGTATIDFGVTPIDEKVFTITDATLSGLTYAEAFFMASDSTSDNDATQHATAGAVCQVICSAPSGSNMNIEVQVLAGFLTGTYKIRYVAN